MKVRIVSKILLLTIAISCLVACGNEDNSVLGKESKAHDYLNSVDKVYQNIYAAIETGEYAEAEEIIQEEIVGNIITEEESQEIMQAYVEALMNDYNEETVSSTDVDLIIRTIEQTSLDEYSAYWYLTDVYYTLKASKDTYQSGQDAYASGDLEDAVKQLSLVNQSDLNYLDALSTLADIAEEAFNESEPELKTSGLAALKCMRMLRAFGYFRTYTDELSVFQDAVDSLTIPEGYDALKDRVAPLAAQIADSMDADGYSMFALHLYSLLRGEMPEAKDKFAKLGRQLYFECSEGDELYSIDENGVINRESDYGFMIDHEDADAVQMVASGEYHAYSNLSSSFCAILRPNGTVRLITTPEAGDMDEFVNFRNQVENLEGVVKLFAPESYIYNQPYLIALTDQGTISFCGAPDSDCYDMLYEGTDIIDFYGKAHGSVPLLDEARNNGEYIVLTSDGNTYVTSSVDNPGQYQQDGVKSIDGFYYFLKDSGDVYISNTRTTEYGQFSSVAGGCAVSEDGELVDLLDRGLNSEVLDYKYSRLVRISHLVGYTADGTRIDIY